MPSSSTLNASPPDVLVEPDSSFAVMAKEVALPAVIVATGVPIDFVASVVSVIEACIRADITMGVQGSYARMQTVKIRPATRKRQPSQQVASFAKRK